MRTSLLPTIAAAVTLALFAALAMALFTAPLFAARATAGVL